MSGNRLFHRVLPMRKKDVDMTEGNILRHIISFAIPLLLGNLFQQLYSTVDTWVVGNYVSNEAYAAVGSVSPIFNVLISFFTGFASGAGVVISQYYGAGQADKVHDTVHTSVLMTIIIGILLAVIGMIITPYMLRVMNTPDNVFPQSAIYLTIIFSGIPALTIYNMGSGILRAVGDSRRPFYFLVISTITNIVLDLLFVLLFGMGVQGVALATVISQIISAILVTVTLLRTDSCVKLNLRHLKIDFTLLKKVLSIGIPSALQMAITSFSNIFVQSYINHFGDNFMSGWTSYSKIDHFIVLPIKSIALASTTFVGQNLGKNQVKRARKGVAQSLLFAVGCSVTIIVPVMIFAEPIVAFFNDKPEVIEYGSLLLHWLTPFYILTCFNHVYAGALRGAGNGKVPMYIMLSSYVLFRQIYLFIVSRVCNEIIPIVMCYPAGWLLACILSVLYFQNVNLGKARITKDPS